MNFLSPQNRKLPVGNPGVSKQIQTNKLTNFYILLYGNQNVMITLSNAYYTINIKYSQKECSFYFK